MTQKKRYKDEREREREREREIRLGKDVTPFYESETFFLV